MQAELAIIQADWQDCRRCPLGERAANHVLWEFVPDANGPVDLMFIGEAPGMSEDVLGQPFVGKSGRLLRSAVAEAGVGSVRIVYANLLACRPQEKRGAPKNRTPCHDEVEACRPRLVSLIQVVRPSVLTFLGRLPEEYGMEAARQAQPRPWPYIINCRHPSFVIRRLEEGEDLRPQFKRRIAEALEQAHYFKRIREQRHAQDKAPGTPNIRI